MIEMQTDPTNDRAIRDAQVRLQLIRKQISDCTYDPMNCPLDINALVKERSALERMIANMTPRM